MIEKLHFITQENEIYTHLRCINAACEAGIKWVQLRIKDKTDEEILEQAIQAREICDQHKVKLIMNDHPDIARKIGADGVHLGKEDMPVDEARKIGSKMIIGATANTIEDVVGHVKNGADYIGLGPFRFTGTKKNLSPILGIEGYQKIMSDCAKKGIDIPIIAIGGITTEDIPKLMETGIHGIAMSGAIANSADMHNEIKRINEIIAR